ncbi:MAG TPA: YdcF family protein [Mucilaginibacter sp.]|nr:YdcF family protein [Mucilaginibacter sp.]
MKKINVMLLGLLLCFTLNSFAQQGYNKNYHLLYSGNLVVDKDFYLLTVITQTPAVTGILKSDKSLQRILEKHTSTIKRHVTDTCKTPVSLLTDFKWEKIDSLEIVKILKRLYELHPKEFDRMIDTQLRPSGYYERFIKLPDGEFYLKAWSQYIYGINYIIDQFGLGKKMRYPLIDSPNYVVTSRYYETVLKDIFASLDEETGRMKLFYQPSLQIALQLMQANDRDEPARFEPLEKGENKKPVEKIKATNWKKYPYAAIVIPGNGPPLTTTPISPDNKIHCDVAARRYLSGKAPFIITTGGYCYPFRGPYCEAVEMRRYLMQQYKIPANAIIIEPQARHTTTNIRNSNRLMIRYGIPINKPSLFITSKSQTDYSANEKFDARNLNELGYLPYRDKKQISNHEISFYPVMECLHMDPFDPLDP